MNVTQSVNDAAFRFYEQVVAWFAPGFGDARARSLVGNTALAIVAIVVWNAWRLVSREISAVGAHLAAIGLQLFRAIVLSFLFLALVSKCVELVSFLYPTSNVVHVVHETTDSASARVGEWASAASAWVPSWAKRL